MQLEAFTQIDPHQFFNMHQSANSGTHRLDTRVSSFAISNDFSGRLDVTTTDGDTITLTADLETDFRVHTYHAQLEADHGVMSVGARTTQFAIQQDFGVAVDGDLTEEELHDLGKLFKSISQFFHGFVEGRTEHAQVETARLAKQFGGLGTLSSLDLSVEVVRSITVAAASSITPGGAPETAAVIPQSSNGTTAPTPSGDFSLRGSLNESVQYERLASLIQRVFDALKEAETELPKFQKYLAEFFEKLHEDLLKGIPTGQEHQVDRHAPSAREGSEEAPSPSANSNVLIAYSSVSLAAFSFSIQG